MPTWTNRHKSKAFEPSVYGVMHFTKFKLACKQVQNKLWMLGILIADHLQNGVEKKVFCQKHVLQASSWDRQGQACWHRGSICLVPRTPTICIFFISILQSRNALSCVKMIGIWVLQLITSEIYLPMKSPNSSRDSFFFSYEKERAISYLHYICTELAGALWWMCL